MTEQTEISTVYRRMKPSNGQLNGSYMYINYKLNWFHTRITVLHYQHMSGILKNKAYATHMIDTQWAVTYYTRSHDWYTMGSRILHTESWLIHNGQSHILYTQSWLIHNVQSHTTHRVMTDTQCAVTYYTVMTDTQWAVTYYTQNHDWYTMGSHTYYTHSHDWYTMCSHILHTESWLIHNGQSHTIHTVMTDTQWAVTYYTHSHDRYTVCSHILYTQSW